MGERGRVRKGGRGKGESRRAAWEEVEKERVGRWERGKTQGERIRKGGGGRRKGRRWKGEEGRREERGEGGRATKGGKGKEA